MKSYARKAWALAGVLTAGVAVVPGAHSAPLGQTASATEGTYAYGGTGDVRFADGRMRYFGAIFAIPKGAVAGSPAVGGADLTKPWAAVSVQGDGASGGLVGGREVCHAFSNPSNWSAGGPGPRTGWGQPTYGGVSFSFSCATDGAYRSFTLTFEPAVTSKGQTFGLYQYPKPEADTQLWGWSAGKGANGTLHANRQNMQAAQLSVCGVRHNGERECHSNPDSVSVIVPAASFTAEAYSAD